MTAPINQNTVNSLEEKLKVAYEELGRLCYAENSDKPEEAYQDKVDEIKGLEEEKNDIEVKLLAGQGKRKCPSCHNILTLESKFCNMCGEKLEPIEIPKEPEAEKPKEEEKAVPSVCPACGTELEEDAAFCPNCGKRCR